MRLLNTIRYAGARLQKMDDAYSARINRMYENANPGVRAAAVMVGGGHPSLRKGQVTAGDLGNAGERQREIGAEILNYALPAINAVPKYVLPATGVTLAGKGIYDLATGGSRESEEKDADRRPYG